MNLLSRVRKLFFVQFQNKETESQYQYHMEKHMLKIVKYYMIVLVTGLCFTLADQLYNEKYLMASVNGPSILINCLAFYYISYNHQTIMYYQLYVGSISFMCSSFQIVIFHLKVFDSCDPKFLVNFDLIHQFTILFNFGQNHNLTSFLYFYFLLTRFYVHYKLGYVLSSNAFLLFGMLFFMDQYYKAELRRKQFLKGKRNKALECLIQEFIDETVCIIEKDNINVRFKPIIINQKLQQITQDINKFIQQIRVPFCKNNLQNYLYSTDKEKETLLCYYNGESYEITYWKFIIDSQKFCIRIKKVLASSKSIINHQQIYQYYQKKLSSSKQQSQLVQRFVGQLKTKTFVFCFNKYYALYKCNFKYYSYRQILQLLESKQFLVDIDVQKPLKTDLQLLNLLLNLICIILKERRVVITQEKKIWKFHFYGRSKTNQSQINYVHQLIDKIQFLIGYGLSELAVGQIKLALINHKYEKFK